MEIFNFKKSEKILFFIFSILFIWLFVTLIYDTISEDFHFLTFDFLIAIGITSIIFFIFDLIAFSSKIILQENGIIYKTIFKSIFHSWDDIKFVAEYKVTLRYTPINGIICSFDFEKDEIKYRHLTVGYTCKKQYLCFPYSEEAMNFLIANLPYGKYIGLAFTDDSF